MFSEEIKKNGYKGYKVTNTDYQAVRSNTRVTIIKNVTEVTKVTEKLHSKALCLSAFECYL